MKGFNIFLGIIVLLFFATLFFLTKMGLDFLYISSTIEFAMLFILALIGKIGSKLSRAKNNQILKWSFIIISLLGFYFSSIPRFILTFYLFFVHDYSINIGGFNTVPQINIPVFILLIISIVSFIISKSIWNKKNNLIS